MVHKPKHRVHSFRGLLTDSDPGNQEEINLERQNVNLAYRIVKLQIIQEEPGEASIEATVKIYREEQSSVDNTINFTDTDLLGVAYFANGAITQRFDTIIIFDNTLFSRNIYVTHSEVDGNASCNYYLEIEEVPVTAATLMQLKLGVARKLNLQQD